MRMETSTKIVNVVTPHIKVWLYWTYSIENISFGPQVDKLSAQ